MARVVWEPPSLADLEQIIHYIDQFDPEAAQNVGARLFDLGESVADFSARGRPAANNTREMITVAPYILRYVLRGDGVLILSIRHSARQPLD